MTETMDNVETFQPDGSSIWMLSVTGTTQHGTSGSPLLDPSGHVVGIEASGLYDLKNKSDKDAIFHKSVALFSGFVIDWLQQVNVKPETVPASQSGDPANVDGAVVKIFCFR